MQSSSNLILPLKGLLYYNIQLIQKTQRVGELATAIACGRDLKFEECSPQLKVVAAILLDCTEDLIMF